MKGSGHVLRIYNARYGREGDHSFEKERVIRYRQPEIDNENF